MNATDTETLRDKFQFLVEGVLLVKIEKLMGLH